MPKNYNAKLPKGKPPVTWSKWTAPERRGRVVKASGLGSEGPGFES